jgi:uncharacterized protein YqjF (DUF2071 family)
VSLATAAPVRTAVPAEGPSPVAPGVDRAVMVQRWSDLAFLHWPYPPDVVQRLLPAGLTVDTFDGRAWVGLIPFRMEGLGLPVWAPLPLVGSFPEVNVRTYVRAGGRRGVWFFSLDVDRVLPTLVARGAYRLPYCSGAASHERHGDRLTTTVERHWPRPERPATTDIVVRTTREPVDDPLTRFVTDRWRLFSRTSRGGLRSAPVDHPRWSILRAEVERLDDTLVRAAGLPHPSGEPLVRWSPGVDVRVGRPGRVRPRS